MRRLVTIVAKLALLCFCMSRFAVGQTQDNAHDDASLSEIWISLVDFAGIDSEVVKKVAPNFPFDMNGQKFAEWIDRNPSESEAILSILNENGIFPSRTQLGLAEESLTYELLLSSSWGNAVATYGSIDDVVKQLPNIPNPAHYCEVAGYKNDVDTHTNWRMGVGFGENANELLDLSSAPDPNELFDKTKYPCLAPYYNAIDYWVYHYPEEYHKLMTDCGCAGTQLGEFVEMPDSIRPDYVSPSERIEQAENYQLPVAENDIEQPIYLTSENPLYLVEHLDDDLTASILEDILMEQGGSGFKTYLEEHLAQEQLSILLNAYTLWTLKNDVSKFEALKNTEGANSQFFTKLELGSLDYVQATGDSFVETFKSHSE